MTKISTLKRKRKEDDEKFQSSLLYIVSSRLARNTCQNKTKPQKNIYIKEGIKSTQVCWIVLYQLETIWSPQPGESLTEKMPS